MRYIIHYTAINQLFLDELGNYSLQSEFDKLYVSFMITRRLKKLPDERKNFLIEKLLSISRIDIPNNLGKELILSWDEVKEMSNDGITFGAHSVNHPVLVNLPLKQARREIIQSKKDIEEKLMKRVTVFSYPNGDFNLELVNFIKESSSTCAVAAIPKLISPKDSPYELGRIGALEDFNKSKVYICGLYHDLKFIFSWRDL